jgi:tellurite methyltransferase
VSGQAQADAGAHLHWDAEWRTPSGRAAWSDPDPAVLLTGRRVRAAGGTHALDVGCGVGRHVLALAELGLVSHGVDLSEAGLGHVRSEADRRGLTVTLAAAPMTALPYPDGSFDLVIAWNVVYHGTADDAATAVSEITRVLRPGGLYQSTMLSKRNGEFGKGQEVAPDVFVQPDGPEDKAHPHLYCALPDILRLHPALRPIGAVDREHGRPESYHWHLLFEKPLSS